MILDVFDKIVRPRLHFKESRFGESIDKRLGFTGPIPVPRLVEGEPTWRHDAASYSCVVECLLNHLCTARGPLDVVNLNGPIDPEKTCVRLIEEVSSSPVTIEESGFKYIIVTAGHLHWLELVFRLHGALVELGAEFRHSIPGVQCSNYVGGADILRSIRGARPRANALIGSVLLDDLFWQLLPMPLVPPTENLSRISQFLLADGRVVPYPDEIKDARPALPREPSDFSRVLTKLTAMYTVFHEIEHVAIGLGKRSIKKELKCDKAATTMSFLSIEALRDRWGLRISNREIEPLAACFAFPVSEQIRQIVALYASSSESDIQCALCGLKEIGLRRRKQLALLLQMTSADPRLRPTLASIANEFRILPRIILELLSNIEPGRKDTFEMAGKRL